MLEGTGDFTERDNSNRQEAGTDKLAEVRSTTNHRPTRYRNSLCVLHRLAACRASRICATKLFLVLSEECKIQLMGLLASTCDP